MALPPVPGLWGLLARILSGTWCLLCVTGQVGSPRIPYSSPFQEDPSGRYSSGVRSPLGRWSAGGSALGLELSPKSGQVVQGWPTLG